MNTDTCQSGEFQETTTFYGEGITGKVVWNFGKNVVIEMESEKFEGSPEEFEAWIEEIRSAGEKMLGLIRRLTDD